MTREQARDEIKNLLDYIRGEKELKPIKTREDAEAEERKGVEALEMAIKALEQEPCGDAVSRQAALEMAYDMSAIDGEHFTERYLVIDAEDIQGLPPVTPQPKTGRCKDCKYFEYDSVAKVDGMPLIVAHEICKKWGDGCKTREDGYCFLFEPQESEDKE
jgi:hypothetical protein